MTDPGWAGRKAVLTDRLEDKPPAVSAITLAHIMGPGDTNLYGTVHGGVVMKLIDDAAAAAAARHSGGPAVTVSVDQLNFLAPAQVGDLLKVTAVVAAVGRSSLDVLTTVFAERWNRPGEERQIVRAFLTFVAVDADGTPRTVPRLLVESSEDRAREAEARRQRSRR
ncbi:acyl-CoA thioesterase [Flexivirga caeni]|uniref:Acyl-CoA thioesterase n=1 Tax=Flexivirga caeni TaxID=2294115 RepID=A0A3M9M999_9MICO|nr:hotdog domain-containing protein [Flexivirga caeni]RNI22141.1 acyl-CoA thioesterase [Flexivirga caeni]